MRPTTLRALAGSALLCLAAEPVAANSGHRHLHSKHSGNHTHGEQDSSLELIKRGKLVNRAGQCAFPEDAGLVAVTPGSMNKGWAMSPDQECTADSYCPFACPSGQLMNQWEPGSSYVYPSSMAGGLYCDKSGKITKPFPSKDYCVSGVGNVKVANNCGGVVAVCQTVLPGNEAMIIPTSVTGSATIAVPDPSYWDSTAAHYYVNPPGYSTADACIWGDGTKPIGNWSPYVIGANKDATGNTYVKLGYNPIYTDSYAGVKPSFGLKVQCDGTCVGLPCIIDPGTDAFGKVESLESATGAGGADFCVVTVTSGSASIVVFNTDGSTGSSDDDETTSTSTTAAKTSTKEPEPEPEPTTTSKVLKVAGHNAEASTTSSSTTTSSSSSSSTTTKSKTTKEATTSRASTLTTVSSTSSSTSLSKSSSASKSTTAKASASSALGGIFQENDSATVTASADVADATATAAAAVTTTSKSNANKDQAAFAGLVVAIVAAACLY